MTSHILYMKFEILTLRADRIYPPHSLILLTSAHYVTPTISCSYVGQLLMWFRSMACCCLTAFVKSWSNLFLHLLPSPLSSLLPSHPLSPLIPYPLSSLPPLPYPLSSPPLSTSVYVRTAVTDAPG